MRPLSRTKTISTYAAIHRHNINPDLENDDYATLGVLLVDSHGWRRLIDLMSRELRKS
jgi:hypothetical protein